MYHALFAVLLVMVGAEQARGEPPGTGDLATADALFVDGKRLVAEQRFAEACARFGGSMALSPRLGVALNLADCYERLGRTASAWVAFGEAAALARRLVDPREGFALQRQEALVPRLSRLRIALTSAPVGGLAVMRDGVPVGPAAYGVEVPVDPGEHVVEVAAPGYRPWSTRIVVIGEGRVATVEIPELERIATPSTPAVAPAAVAPAAAAMASAAPPVAPAADPGRRITPSTWIALGVTAVGLGVGAGFGIAARSLGQQARRDCDPSGNCTDAAAAAFDRSRRDGNVSTAAFAVAGAALVTAAVLSLWRGDRPRAVRLGLEVAPGGPGVAVSGAW